MKNSLVLFILIISYSCAVTKNVYKITKNDKVEEYANSITAEELKKHLSVIASDEYEGRETGKKGQIMAAEYLKNEFQNDGVAPGNNGSYLQQFPLLETSVPEAKITTNGKSYEFSKDFYFYNSMIKIESFNVNTTEIIDLSYGILDSNRDDYKSIILKGKTVIINLDKIEKYKTWSWRKKLEIAKEKRSKNNIIYLK
ncbi:hypothetical protein N9P38_00570 [Flavobacteriales bacterium]|nr:hypothetical protein [Flavobacteriales bacterium]